MRRRRTEEAHPRTTSSAKHPVEVRLLRRRAAGRMSPQGANLAVAAGSPLLTTPRRLATVGTTSTAMPHQPAVEVGSARRSATVAAAPTAEVHGPAALAAQPPPLIGSAVVAEAAMVAAAGEAAEAPMAAQPHPPTAAVEVAAMVAAAVEAPEPAMALPAEAAMVTQHHPPTGTAAGVAAGMVAAAEAAMAVAATAVEAAAAAAVTAEVVAVEEAPPPPPPAIIAGIAPHRYPNIQVGEPSVDDRGFGCLNRVFNPANWNSSWSLRVVQNLASGLGLRRPTDLDEAFHTLRSLDHSIHVANVVGSTSDCVTADVAANNFAFAPRGDLRSVAQYHFWALAQILRISYHPAELHFQGLVDVGDLYNVRELGDPPVNANNPATYRRAQSTVYLSSNEAVDLCAAWAVQVVQRGDSEFDLWDALSGVETQMESNPGATQQFFTAWRSGAGRSRAERFYHALTALRQPATPTTPSCPGGSPPLRWPRSVPSPLHFPSRCVTAGCDCLRPPSGVPERAYVQ